MATHHSSSATDAVETIRTMYAKAKEKPTFSSQSSGIYSRRSKIT